MGFAFAATLVWTARAIDCDKVIGVAEPASKERLLGCDVFRRGIFGSNTRLGLEAAEGKAGLEMIGVFGT